MLNDIEASISFENLTNPKHRDGRRRQIEEYVKEGNYELDLRNPKEADFTYLAFVVNSQPISSVDSTLIIWPLIADKMSVLTVIMVSIERLLDKKS
jgi:hypothetical protein